MEGRLDIEGSCRRNRLAPTAEAAGRHARSKDNVAGLKQLSNQKLFSINWLMQKRHGKDD